MRSGIVAAILGMIFAVAAAAQDRGGLRGEVTLGFGALHQSGETSVLGSVQTRVQSQTRRQMLLFDVDLAKESQSKVALEYTRRSKSSLLDVKLRHMRTPLGAALIDPFLTRGYVDISSAQSDQTASMGGIKLHFGIDRPSGIEIDLTHRRRKMRDAIGVQQDGRRTTFETEFRADLNRRSSAKLRLGYGQFESFGAQPVRQLARRFGVGLSHKVNARVSLDIDAGWGALRRHEGGQDTESSGLEFAFGLTSRRRAGLAFMTLSREVTNSGGLVVASVGAERDVKDGKLRFTVGVARQGGGSEELTGRASFAKTYAKGALKAEVAREYVRSDLSADLGIASRASVHVRRDVGDLGGLDLRVDVAKRDGNSAQSMAQVRVAYTHSLSKDWAMAGGAHRRFSRDASRVKRSESGIFLRLERRFAGGL